MVGSRSERVKFAEPVQPGDGGAHERFGGVVARQRRDTAHVRADDGCRVAGLALRGTTQRRDEIVVDRADRAVGADRAVHAAPRSSRRNALGR